jgi:hypothetical protein
MNIAPLKREIEQLAKDKGIDRETIIPTPRSATRSASSSIRRTSDASSRRPRSR